MNAPERRRRRLVTLVTGLIAVAVVAVVMAASVAASSAGPGPLPARVTVPAVSGHPVSGPLAAAADAGDPGAIGAPGTEGSDGTTGGGDRGVDGSSASGGITAPATDPNAADDPEGQFGPTDSSGTVLDPNQSGTTDPSLGMTP
jgi:hypothetical protein